MECCGSDDLCCAVLSNMSEVSFVSDVPSWWRILLLPRGGPPFCSLHEGKKKRRKGEKGRGEEKRKKEGRKSISKMKSNMYEWG